MARDTYKTTTGRWASPTKYPSTLRFQGTHTRARSSSIYMFVTGGGIKLDTTNFRPHDNEPIMKYVPEHRDVDGVVGCLLFLRCWLEPSEDWCTLLWPRLHLKRRLIWYIHHPIIHEMRSDQSSRFENWTDRIVFQGVYSWVRKKTKPTLSILNLCNSNKKSKNKRCI